MICQYHIIKDLQNYFLTNREKKKKIKNINFWNKIVGNIKSISKKKF